jgi:hypothetical protein
MAGSEAPERPRRLAMAAVAVAVAVAVVAPQVTAAPEQLPAL